MMFVHALIRSWLFCGAVASSWPMVGSDAYRKYDFYKLRPRDITRQFSSYDRNNLNDDGFEGTYSCLYNTTSGRCVIAEADGPGQISDIWFTYANDSVLGVGNIEVELDSKIVLKGLVQDIVNGALGAPFVWPLVGNVNDTSGGNVIKVPMPYQKSMRVSMSTNPHFYHLMYRTFPDDVKVETFDPKEKVTDILDANLAFGVQDPKGDDYWNGKCDVKTSKACETLKLTGSGIIDEIQIRIPEIEGAYVVTDDGRAFGKGGSSSFTMQVDGSASQCSLTRRMDRTIGNQVASVSVDGEDAGSWEPLPSENATWYDQVLMLDPTLIDGKSSIKFRNSFVSSDLDFNEFYYATHCKSHSSGDWRLTDLLNVGWNNLYDEEYHDYEISGETWQGLRQWYTYGGERKNEAQESIDALDSIYLTLEFDGYQTVVQPLGSFFGVALGKFGVRSLLMSVDNLTPDGAFTSWWPMPFAKSFSLSLSRFAVPPGSGPPVEGSISVKWHKDKSLKASKDWGYFATQYRRAETITGKLWHFLSEAGAGVAYGVTHAIRGSIKPPNNTLEFLEGDFKTWYGRTKPGPFKQAAILGTGTEDFYESGWCVPDIAMQTYKAFINRAAGISQMQKPNHMESPQSRIRCRLLA